MSTNTAPTLAQRTCAEILGTAFLLIAVVGSGIMASRLAGGNGAVALLCNSLATGAALTVLISILAPVSGAHFNPVVTMVLCMRGKIAARDAAGYVLGQIAGAILGVLAAHLMFSASLFQISQTARAGTGLVFAEAIATFGLIVTILLTMQQGVQRVALNAGLYITAAYWFTASTSFANPAVTIARALTDTYAGIRPVDVPVFIVAQVLASLIAARVAAFLAGER